MTKFWSFCLKFDQFLRFGALNINEFLPLVAAAFLGWDIFLGWWDIRKCVWTFFVPWRLLLK